MAWDDDDYMNFNFDDLSPEEKERIEKELHEKDEKLRKHPLYLKANEIFNTVRTMSETFGEEEREMYINTLLESAMVLAPKFAGAIASESWLASMQNASIMRYHAQYIHSSTSMLDEVTEMPKEYVKVLRNEMEEFRGLFIEWIKTFDELEHDDPEDEWGLFIKK